MRCRSRTPRTSATGRGWTASHTPCGHDVHTTVVLGAGLALQRLACADQLDRGVRLIFQPRRRSRSRRPRFDVIGARWPCGPDAAVRRAPATRGSTSARSGLKSRCDHGGERPCRGAADRGLVATLQRARIGPRTSSQPLGAVITQVPALLARRVDPRSGGRAGPGGWANAGTAAKRHFRSPASSRDAADAFLTDALGSAAAVGSTS